MQDEQIAAAAKFWLAGLTDKAFAEFFYDVVRERARSPAGRHFVLAEADRVGDEPWSVDCIAVHESEKTPRPWADDVPICQSGTCSACGAEVRSWAKNAVCPVCSAKVYCT